MEDIEMEEREDISEPGSGYEFDGFVVPDWKKIKTYDWVKKLGDGTTEKLSEEEELQLAVKPVERGKEVVTYKSENEQRTMILRRSPKMYDIYMEFEITSGEETMDILKNQINYEIELQGIRSNSITYTPITLADKNFILEARCKCPPEKYDVLLKVFKEIIQENSKTTQLITLATYY